MTKIMLVEDDNNLREIYEARLAAEGFTIVSAQDGEAALALAAKEHPDLVISDVMMPKISGFEMLDIMRNTANLRDVKVIMLTALGQAEDSARAGSLGADRYLVKSQVTLEDIVKAAHEVIDGPKIEEPGVSSPANYAAAPAETPPAADVATDGQPWNPAPPDTQEPAEAVTVEPPTPEPENGPSTVDQPVYEASVPADPDEVHEEVEAGSPDGSDESSADTPLDIEVVEQSVPSSSTEPDQVHQEPKSDDQTIDVQVEDPVAAASDAVDDNTDSASDDIPAPVDTPADDSDGQSNDDNHTDESGKSDEADMRARIDQFLDDDVADTPVEQAESTEIGQITVAEPPADSSQPDVTETDIPEADEAPLPDEPDSEYDKDAATPDMGELSVQSSPEEATPAPPEYDQVAVEPPAPAFDLPDVPQPAETPVSAENSAPTTDSEVAPTPPVSYASGDKIVSDAVNHMMASAPSSMQPPDPFATTPDMSTADPTKPASQEQLDPLEQATTAPLTPEQPLQEYQSSNSSTTHKRVIAPLGMTETKPNINQLLALEEAKNGAQQASNAPQGPQKFSVAPPPGIAPPPPSSRYEGQSFDPNSISL